MHTHFKHCSTFRNYLTYSTLTISYVFPCRHASAGKVLITCCYSIDGEQLEKAEARLLGEILKASNTEFRETGVNVQQLLDGGSGLTYEEMQFVMKKNDNTRILSKNLKQELQTSELCMHIEVSCHDSKQNRGVAGTADVNIKFTVYWVIFISANSVLTNHWKYL